MPQCRCLFIVQDYPLTPDASGQSALSYSHLELLVHAGCEVHLVILSDPRASQGFSDFTRTQADVWEAIQGWCASCRFLQLDRVPPNRNRPATIVHAISNPLSYGAEFGRKAVDGIRQVIEEVKPDLIWADHFSPATLAIQSEVQLPVVYGHHDWKWRIKPYRAGRKGRSLKSRAKYLLLRRYEETLVQRVAGCTSASFTETEDLRQVGARHVAYLPTTYRPVTIPNQQLPVLPPRVVHLGSMAATANRIGLQRFMEVGWPDVIESCREALPELWVIGALEGAPESLLTLLQGARAVCPGFVPQLETVLRPGDIHVVPWEHNTGTRTRIPLALNYGQVIVTTRAAAACLPELEHEINCVIVDRLSEMAEKITALINDESRRALLASAARQTFLEHFTREAVQPRFNAFLQEVIAD